jgi:hypothetical protein
MKRTVLLLVVALAAAPALAFSQGPADKSGHVPPAGAPAVAPDALAALRKGAVVEDARAGAGEGLGQRRAAVQRRRAR